MRTLAPAAAVALSLAGASMLAAQAASLDDLVEWTGRIELEETDAVVNARPVFSPDPQGGLIVADLQENQVRLYDGQGYLKAYFGREGDGPGEFRALMDACRDSTGRLVALTGSGRVSIWSAMGDSVISGSRTVPRGYSIGALHGEAIAVAATPIWRGDEYENLPLIHVLRPGHGDLGLVRPRITNEMAAAFGTVTGARIEGLGRWKAVTAPLVDSLWVVDADSLTVVRKLGIPSRVLRENEPPRGNGKDMAAFLAWVRETWFVDAAYPLAPGGWLVTLWRRPGDDVEWGLLKMTESGEVEWEREDVPHLLTVDGGGRLIFDDPDSLLPNVLLVARLRGAEVRRQGALNGEADRPTPGPGPARPRGPSSATCPSRALPVFGVCERA